MADPGETLIPGETIEDARVDAAVASAMGLDEAVVEEDVVPFGMSWSYDFEAGRFVRAGSGAVPVYGEDGLVMWCQMAVHSTRFAHDVFSEAFGIESLDDLIGSVMAAELVAEFEARLRDALLVHDRIVAVEDVAVTYSPADDVFYLDTFTVVTDEEERVSVNETTTPGRA